MDYAFQKRLLRYLALGVAEDELDWTAHDKRYHGGHFDPKTMTCKARRAADEGDLADVLTAEREEADYKKLAQKLEKERVKRDTAERIERKTIAELTSRDYTDEDREMVDAALRHVMTAKPVEVTMQEANRSMRKLRATKPKDLRDNLTIFFKQTYPEGINVKEIGKVELTKESVKSIMAHARKGLTLTKYAAIANIDKLLQGKIFCVHAKWKGRSWNSVNLVSPLAVAENDFVVEMTIKQKDGESGANELYNIKVIPKKVISEEITPHVTTPKGGREKNTPLTTPYSLPKISSPVNGGLEENLKPPKLPSSNLVRQYLAAHGLLSKYLPPTPANDAALFDSAAFRRYLASGGVL